MLTTAICLTRVASVEFALARSFCSLYQKGAAGEPRTPAETNHFSTALGSLSLWYSHPKTIVLKITKLPEGYPNGFSFPEGITANQADYYDRGWCYCESSLCNMVKDFDYVLDLAKIPPIALADAREDVRAIARACRAGRAVPLLPATFSDQLASKSFTSKKADLHVVSSIYAEGYRMRMASSKLFNYTGLQWGDEELTSLAEVLRGGGLALAEELFLNMNRLTDTGVAELASAIRAATDGPPRLSHLVTLNLSSNQIGNAGASALADALGSGALPNLKEIHLEQNEVSAEWQQKLSELLAARRSGKETAGGGEANDADSSAAEEAYRQAIKAAQSVRKGDLQEVKSMSKPPQAVVRVVECVAILLDQTSKTKEGGFRKLLNDMKFVHHLTAFDVHNVTQSMLEALDPYLQDDEFAPQNLARYGRLCGLLCTWVRGMALMAKHRRALEA